jgi:sporulation protein YabP
MEKDNKVILVNQKNLTITGIKKVLAVSETSISLLLETSTMHILGEKMEVKKLDVESGLLEVEGKITNIKYLGAKEKTNLFKRIFK